MSFSKHEKDKEKVKQEKYQTILADLLKDEENKYCADCDAKGPRWAAWNLGVFLCIRCAGIHRNLGCHVSRVKSINLDSWNAEQLQHLREIGNSRARAIYEAMVPDSFRRPQTDSTLETFIRAKYEIRKYIAKEWIPPTPHQIKAKAKELDDHIERDLLRAGEKKKRTHHHNSALSHISAPAIGNKINIIKHSDSKGVVISNGITSMSTKSSLTNATKSLGNLMSQDTLDNRSDHSATKSIFADDLNDIFGTLNPVPATINNTIPSSMLNKTSLPTNIEGQEITLVTSTGRGDATNPTLHHSTAPKSSSQLLNDIFAVPQNPIANGSADDGQNLPIPNTNEAILALYPKNTNTPFYNPLMPNISLNSNRTNNPLLGNLDELYTLNNHSFNNNGNFATSNLPHNALFGNIAPITMTTTAQPARLNTAFGSSNNIMLPKIGIPDFTNKINTINNHPATNFVNVNLHNSHGTLNISTNLVNNQHGISENLQLHQNDYLKKVQNQLASLGITPGLSAATLPAINNSTNITANKLLIPTPLPINQSTCSSIANIDSLL